MRLFRSILWWILAIIVGIALTAFAIHNTQATDLNLWPAPFAIKIPLFIIVLGAIILGFLAGALVMWIAAGRSRQRARKRGRQVRTLSSKLEEAEAEIARQAPAQPGTPADPSRALRPVN